MNTTSTLATSLVLLLSVSACAVSACAGTHGTPPDAATPDAATVRDLAPDAAAPDAFAALDAASPDAWLDDPLSDPCPPDFVDEGDACVAWRGIPAPPCEPVALAQRDDGSVAVRCEAGALFSLTPTSTWEYVDGPAYPLVPETDDAGELGPATPILVTFYDGSRVATHGDVYAHPAAWRSDGDGTWRETVPPPSAFVTHGASISDREALFVGRDAFVVTVIRRTHLGW